jgi:hypothetical protein
VQIIRIPPNGMLPPPLPRRRRAWLPGQNGDDEVVVRRRRERVDDAGEPGRTRGACTDELAPVHHRDGHYIPFDNRGH